jgi:type IV secretory pathway VirB4 component
MANPSSQEFLPFEEIRKGTIILKNKTLRGILMISSLNFALKSEDEQNATIYQFQGFLNSLDFPCQIIVQSRRINITGYFEKLKELEQKHTNELLKTQTTEYRKFIEELVEEETIMRKTFFIVVPYAPGEMNYGYEENNKKGFSKKTQLNQLTEESFKRCRNQLWQRMEFIAIGLRRCGLSILPLTTPELIEILWSWHHPKEAEVGYYPEILPELIK